MISRLVEARPEDLRAFLEEAAGISKYKERRRETEHRIRRTRENLERLSDLREEVGKQISHLQRQARAAERFKSLKAEQRRMEAELLTLRLSSLQDDYDARRVHRDEKQTGLEAALAQQRATEAQIEELRLNLDERNEQHGEVRSRALKVDSEISRLEQSLEHRRKLRHRQKQDLEDIAGQLAQSQALSDSDRAAIQQVDRLLDELAPDLERTRQRTSGLPGRSSAGRAGVGDVPGAVGIHYRDACRCRAHGTDRGRTSGASPLQPAALAGGTRAVGRGAIQPGRRPATGAA